jgi:dTDP-4-amino-4,6-dideoxygalactose transaminase
MIPQTNPRAGYVRRAKEIHAAVARVMESGHYILGEEVQHFEQAFARFAEAAHAVGVANGTDALVVGLLALSVKPGDVVITVSHTAVATVAAIEMIGAAPLLVDIDHCYGMDIGDVTVALQSCAERGRKVAAIIPVHIYGQAVDMRGLQKAAASYGVPILEDCSQAHGAALGKAMVGSFGQIAAYSCYPTKNLGAIGDAGVITTNDEALARRMAALRQYGWYERFVSEEIGRNSRLDEMQAAILRVKLATLSADNARRGEIATAYDEGLETLPIDLPRRRKLARHVFHQYVIGCDRRDALKQHLLERGIGTGIHYPVPVHLQPAYKGRVATVGDLPRTTAAAGRVLSLPMFPELSDAEVSRVIEVLRRELT